MRQAKNETVNTAPGYRVALILLGIAITPVLLSSSSLGNQLSNAELIRVLAIGSAILALLASITTSIGEKARLPTYGIVKYAFGEQGAVAINILMAVSLFGWICVTANMFGSSMQDLLLQQGIMLPFPLLVALGCVIFVGATAFGFAVLGKVALFAVPVIALVLCFILSQALRAEVAPAAILTQMDLGVAVSTVVGTIIVLVATLPDFGSFVHNRRHAIIAALLTFALAYPLLFWVGAVPSALSGEGSLLAAAAVFGVGVPAGLLMLFATISGNAGNMFQGTLVVSTLLTRFPKWQITLTLGVLATLIGSMDILAWFIPFLLFLGIATPPVAGIYIADFFLYRRQGYQESVLAQESQIKVMTFVAWGIGSCVGFMTVNGLFTLTTIPSLDSILLASLCYTLFSRLSRTRAYA